MWFNECVCPMISACLKRKWSGLEPTHQPPVKVRLLCEIQNRSSLVFSGCSARQGQSPKKRCREETSSPADPRQVKRSRMVAHSKMAPFSLAREETYTAAKKSVKQEPEIEEFNSYNFWKPVLPDIETELIQFLQEKMDVADTGSSINDERKKIEDPEEFNAFNFWRTPVPEIDLDLENI